METIFVLIDSKNNEQLCNKKIASEYWDFNKGKAKIDGYSVMELESIADETDKISIAKKDYKMWVKHTNKEYMNELFPTVEDYLEYVFGNY